MNSCLAVLLVASLMVTHTDSFPSGAPTSACTTMIPNHSGAVNQFSVNNPSPYVIEVPRGATYGANSQIQVRLKGTQPWKGFLIEARRAGSSDTNSYGYFTGFDAANFHTITCDPGSNNGLTQSNANVKTSDFYFTWVAPPNNIGDINIVATVCYNTTTYWSQITSASISPNLMDCSGADSADSDFYLAFPTDFYTTPNALTLFFTPSTPSFSAITVTVTTPQYSSWSGTTVVINPGQSGVARLPTNLMLTSGEANLEGKGIRVQSTADITVFASSMNTPYCGGYQAQPYSVLGNDYFVVTQWSLFSNFGAYSQFAIVATSDNTVVTITFPAGLGININYNGNGYGETQPLTLTMNKLQTFQLQEIQDQADLTGTRIQSNQPIAVFAGDSIVAFSNTGTGIFDHAVEQMIPVSAYGTTFAVIASPNQDPIGIQTTLHIVSPTTNIRVTAASGTSDVQTGAINQQNYLSPQLSVNNQQFFCVTAPSPFAVTQVIRDRSSWQYGLPSFVVIPSTSQYLSSYALYVPETLTQAYLLISIGDNTYSYIKVDGAPISGVTWNTFVGCPTTMYGAYVPITAGYHYLTHALGHNFGAYVYGLDGNRQCTMALQGGGMCMYPSLRTSNGFQPINPDSSVVTTTTAVPTALPVPTTTTTAVPTAPPTTTTTAVPTAPPTTTTTAVPTAPSTTTIAAVPTTTTVAPSQSSAVCPVGYAGQTFVFAFPENLGAGGLVLYITSATSSSASVQIYPPLATSLWSGTTVTVQPGSTTSITVPATLQLSGLGIQNNALYITASNNIVVFGKNLFTNYCGTFQVIPQVFLGTRYHAITTWPDSLPDSNKNSGNIAVVASSPGTTTVTFTFPQDRGISIRINGVTYGTTPLTITLNQYQTYQLQDNVQLPDFTGTLVSANQPIAVFSGNIAGNVNTDYGYFQISDHSVEQMIPTTAYGTTFYAVEFPGQAGTDTYLRIICREDSTTIFLNGVQTANCNAQGVVDRIQTVQFNVISSSKPVTVGQINEGAGSSRSQGTPALVVVPPTTAYLSLYTFIVPTGIDTATLILTVPNGAQNGIYINSAPINTQWTAFPNAGNVYGARYPLTPGVYTVQHTSNALFGAYVYGKDSADSCSVAFSAGMNVGTATNCGTTGPTAPTTTTVALPTTTTINQPVTTTTLPPTTTTLPPTTTTLPPTTTTLPPTTTTLPPTTTTLPPTTTTLPPTTTTLPPTTTTLPPTTTTLPPTTTTLPPTTTTVTAPVTTTPRQPVIDEPDVGCQNDTYGTEFVVMFTDQFNYNPSISLRAGYTSGVPTSYVISTPLIVSGPSSYYSSSTLVSPSIVPNYLPSGLSNSAWLSTNGGNDLPYVENRGIRVTAGRNIGLFGMSRGPAGSCDGYTAIPVDQLGTEYYVLSHWPPNHSTEVGIVATKDNTVIKYTIPVSQGVRLIYNGVTYGDNQTLTINMNAYQVILFQNGNDLSGSRIVSNFPVAVFSGNDLTSVSASSDDPNFDLNQQSYLVEQLPPVPTWGYNFFIYPDPARTIFVRIVASQPNTQIYVNGFYYAKLNLPGKFIPFQIKDPNHITLITTDKPSLTVEYASSLPADAVGTQRFPTMFVMPPVEQYRNQYWVNMGELRSAAPIHYLGVIIDQANAAGLQLDGVPVTVDNTWLPGVNNTYIGKGFVVSPGPHYIRHVNNAPFGLYVYGISTDDCSYSYAGGQCLNILPPRQFVYTTQAPTTAATTTQAPTTVAATTAAPTAAPTVAATTAAPTTVVPTAPATTAAPVTVPVTTPAPAQDCTCQTVTLWSQNQPTISGIYYYTVLQDNGRVVYKQQGVARYLYYYSSLGQTQYWVVGARNNVNRGYEVGYLKGAVTTSQNPMFVTTWRYYNYTSQTWLNDNTLTVSCACKVGACNSAMFMGSGLIKSYLTGAFTPVVNQTWNGYQVYQTNQPMTLYLYFNWISGCPLWAGGSADTSSKTAGYWAIGSMAGSSTAIAYVFDEATTPCDVSGAWTFVYNGAPTVDSQSNLMKTS